jgi:hypothetical protein
MTKPSAWDRFPFNKRGRFNGKRRAYWEREGTKLVVEYLVRAADASQSSSSLPSALAAERLLALAEAESPEIFAEVCADRDRSRFGLCELLVELLAPCETK